MKWQFRAKSRHDPNFHTKSHLKMSFWSVPSKSRRRSPESEMFFDTATNFARQNLADRLGSSVFDDFPASRRSAAAMRNFPDQMPFGPSATGSLHRHHHHPRHHAPSWLSSEDFADSRESPPRHQAYQRADSGGNIPAASRATPPASRQDSQHGSRSSTPESTGSGHSHRSRASATSTGTDEGVNPLSSQQQYGDEPPLEEHPGVTARNGRQSFTARRQPKVHHIPIHVEPRDGSSTPVVLTPPVDGNANEYYQHPQYQQQQQQQHSESPPVTRSGSQSGQETPMDGIASSSSQSSVTGGGGAANASSSKTVSSPPVSKSNSGSNTAATSGSASSNSKKPPPVRAKTKMATDAGGGHRSPVHHVTKPVVPEPVFPTSAKSAAAEPEATKPAATAKQPIQRKTPLEVVNDVLEDVAKLREVVAQFDGQKGDKRFLYLDEMLTRNLIRLDNITPDGNEEVRLARRGAVLAINDCLALLDSRAGLTGGEADVQSSSVEGDPTTTSEAIQEDNEAAEMKDGSQEESRVDDASAMDAECTISYGGGDVVVDNQSAATTDPATQEFGDAVQPVTTPMDTDDGAAHTDVPTGNQPTSVEDNNKVLEQSTEASADAESKTETVEVAGSN